MTQHTQGPWAISRTEQGTINTEYIICSANKHEFAAVGAELVDEGGEAYANARLIAAAPELLEALETLEYEASQEDINTPLNLAILKARKAIAKAKGI